MVPTVCAGRSHTPWAAGEDPFGCAHTTAQGALTPMDANVLYADHLVEISAEAILFRRYYFPFGSKRLRLSEIERVVVEELTSTSAKYRIQGNAGLHTWFPMDLQRPRRSKIFLVSLRDKKLRIAFTVEDEGAVETILRAKNLL